MFRGYKYQETAPIQAGKRTGGIMGFSCQTTDGRRKARLGSWITWPSTLRRGRAYEKIHTPFCSFPAYLKGKRELNRSLQNAQDFPGPGEGRRLYSLGVQPLAACLL